MFVNKKKKLVYVYIFVAVLVLLRLEPIQIFFREIFSPKVAIIKDFEKHIYVKKEKSTMGHIYYDEETDKVRAYCWINIVNKDNKEHKVTFTLDSSEYLDYKFIKSDFKIVGIYESFYPEEKYISKDEITLLPESKLGVKIVATADFGGQYDRRRVAPPVELVVLE